MKRKFKLEKEVGIWLDEKNAYIIILDNSGKPAIEKIDSDVELRERFPGGEKPYTQFRRTFDNYEGKRQRRQKQERERYFEMLINRVQDANYIYLFGPGKAKEELNNRIQKEPTFQNKLIRLETTGRLTQNQMAQKVKGYYRSDDSINRRNESSRAGKEFN